MHLTRPPCMTLVVIHNKYRSRPRSEDRIRFGQYFCNNYVKKFDSVTDGIFNMGFEKATDAINEWLHDNGYTDTTPPTNSEVHRI